MNTITPPKGFALPEGIGPGEEFDMVCTLKTCGVGKLCVCKVGDNEMDSGKDTDMAKPSYDKYVNSMQTQQGDTGGDS